MKQKLEKKISYIIRYCLKSRHHTQLKTLIVTVVDILVPKLGQHTYIEVKAHQIKINYNFCPYSLHLFTVLV